MIKITIIWQLRLWEITSSLDQSRYQFLHAYALGFFVTIFLFLISNSYKYFSKQR